MNTKLSKDFYIYIDIDDFISDKKHKLKHILERIHYLSDNKKLELEANTVLVLYVKYNSLVKKFSIIDDIFIVQKFIDYYNRTYYESKKETDPIRSFLIFKKPLSIEDNSIIKIKDYCTCKLEYTRNIFISLMKYFSKDIVFYSVVSLLQIKKVMALYKIGLRNISCGDKDYIGEKIETNSIQLSLNDKYYIDEELSDKVYFILQSLKNTERENATLTILLGTEIIDEITYKMYGEREETNGMLYSKNISDKKIDLCFEKKSDNSLYFKLITLSDPYYDENDKLMEKIPLIHKSILNDEIHGCFIFSYKKVYFISLSIDFLYTFYFIELLIEDLKEKTFQYLYYTTSLLGEEEGISILKNMTLLDLIDFLELDRKTLSAIDLLKCENIKLVNIQEYTIESKTNNPYVFYFSKYGKYNCREKYFYESNKKNKPTISLQSIVDRISVYLSSVNKL